VKYQSKVEREYRGWKERKHPKEEINRKIATSKRQTVSL
jgi:hypothetical protein